MNINLNNISFKGYDAAPLKNVYLEGASCSPILEEMDEIAENEGFRVQVECDYRKWMQDDKIVIDENGDKKLLYTKGVSNNFINCLKYRHNIFPKSDTGFVTGGNSFVGFDKSGEKWLLGGFDDFDCKEKYDEVSSAYGVKKENILVIPQPDYHLDMAIRPIGYPYVLINDYDIALRNLEKLNDGSDEFNDMKTALKYFKKYQDEEYADCDETELALILKGFIPIRIAGNYGEGVNFMNAIVNKHADGKISYITNSSKSKNKFYSKLQEMFEEDLRKSVPNVDKVYFVEGKTNERFSNNYMMRILKYQGGGIHCLSLEEPDFDKWA